MMKTKNVGIFVLLLLIGQSMFAQDNTVKNILIEQHKGIINQPVHDVMVDLNGVVWIASENGLFNFNIVEEEKVNQVKVESVHAMAMGENETGWVGFYNNKIGIFDREISYSTGLRASTLIRTMTVDKNNVWIGTTDGLYKIVLKAKEESKHYHLGNSKIPSNMINDIFVCENGNKYIATDNGLVKFDGKRWDLVLKDKNISTIEHHDGDLWVTGEGRMWKYKRYRDWEELSLIEEFRRAPINDLLFDGSGNLWIASNVLGRYDKDWIPSVYDEKVGFSSTHVLSLAIDGQSTIWAGTAGHGLFKLKLNGKTVEPKTYVDKPKQNNLEVATKKTETIDPQKEGMVLGMVKGGEMPLIANSEYIGNRIIKAGKVVEVKDQRVEIGIWDGQDIDGDIISLFYNGECILKEYDLTNKRKKITLKVIPGASNQLVLYAHTSGEVGVNTAMVALLKKDKPKHWVLLTSDSQRCDKINFKVVR